MRMLSVLVILAVALQAGTALAGAKKLAQVRDQNRANVMQYYNKVQRAYDQTQKKLNSAKYLEDLNHGISPNKGPNVVPKRKETKTRIQSGNSSGNNRLRKGSKDLSKQERALLKNLGWDQQIWKHKDTPGARWPVGSSIKHRSQLSAEEQSFIQERAAATKERVAQVRKLQKQKARELRTKRRPRARR